MAVDKSDVNFLDPSYPIQFEGYVKSMRTNERDGEMILSVAIPPEWKFHALLTTDYPGTMFDIRFIRQDTSGGDDGEVDEDTGTPEPPPSTPPLTTTHEPAPPRFESPWQTTDS